MKRLLFSTLLLITASAYAQSERYEKAMMQNISKLDSANAKGADAFTPLADNFTRIGDAEKTQWLPYYYASYASVMSALMMEDKSKVDIIADKADALLKKAETLAGKENSETCVIRSMIASAHMMVDPQSRYMQYGAVSASNLEKAKAMDPTNPRPVYLEGQSKFYTPEQFGGGKTAAKEMFKKALSMFSTFKPATNLSPKWGEASTKYFLTQAN
ncbi:MAG: hypothetical protein ABI151_17205 [Chitinophagaceae bacterium]